MRLSLSMSHPRVCSVFSCFFWQLIRPDAIPAWHLNHFLHNLCGCARIFLSYFSSLNFLSLLRFFQWLLRCSPLLSQSLSVNTVLSILDTCMLLRHEDKQHEISAALISILISQSERAKPCQCYIDSQRQRVSSSHRETKEPERAASGVDQSPLAQWSIDSAVSADLDDDPLVKSLFGSSVYRGVSLSSSSNSASSNSSASSSSPAISAEPPLPQTEAPRVTVATGPKLDIQAAMAAASTSATAGPSLMSPKQVANLVAVRFFFVWEFS